jgi:hypothetical protein
MQDPYYSEKLKRQEQTNGTKKGSIIKHEWAQSTGINVYLKEKEAVGYLRRGGGTNIDGWVGYLPIRWTQVRTPRNLQGPGNTRQTTDNLDN